MSNPLLQKQTYRTSKGSINQSTTATRVDTACLPHKFGIASEYSSALADESHYLGDGRLIPILFGWSHVIANRRGITLPRCEKQIAFQTMLLGVQLEVTSAQRIELFVSAAFDNLSLLDHQNLIGAPNGRQAVRDHKGRAALHQVGEPLLNHLLGFGIEAGGGLVQNQNAGFSQNGACNRDPLPLPAR